MHCVTCHLTFASPTTCDLHQPNASGLFRPRCVAPESVGLIAKPNQWGTDVWGRVVDEVTL